MSNLHNAPDGREPLNLANRQPDAAATPFLQAVHRYRADMLEARRLSATDDGDDVLSEAEDRFHASTEAAIPFRHLPDALAAVEWVRADLAAGQCGNQSDWPSDVRQRDTLLNGVGDFLRMAAETGDQALSSPAPKTTIIPAVGPTVWEAAHPDAALFAAWDGLKKSYRAFNHARDVLLPDGGTDKDHEPYYETMEIHERQIRQHEASTVEGFAIQLRYLFAMRMESLNSFMVALYGDPLERELVAELDEDYRDKMLWSMAQAAARASARDHWKDDDDQRPADTNAPPPSPPPDDAELLNLWDRYLPLKAETERLFGYDDGDEWERASAPCAQLEDRMAAIPARTAAGLAVKLAVLWQWGGADVDGQTEHSNERRDGANPMSDFTVRWLWMVLNEARALGVPMPVIPNDATNDPCMAAALSRGLVLESEDNHPIAYSDAPGQPANGNATTVDAFASAVTAFQDEASATLALPQRPTGGMVEAGASAAGITPQQFQAAYAAAMAAFQQERAA